jgi:transposase
MMRLQRTFQEELRMMKFTDIAGRYAAGSLGCEDAAELLGISPRTFLRWRDRHAETGTASWTDKRVGKVSPRKAADAEIEEITQLYRDKYSGFNVAHFHTYLRMENQAFCRSYSWVKRTLGAAGLVFPGKQGGDHRLRRPRRPQTGMMIHQDASTHNWFGIENCDLIVTMDDADSRITSAFFCAQEGTNSSMRGIKETIEQHGMFCSFYTDRGSHYWFTPEAGGKVDKARLTDVGRALKQLGINHIAAYSPQARGRSERMFGTLQGRLPAELTLHNITTMEAANVYLRDVYLPRHNKEFTVAPEDAVTAFIPYVGRSLVDICSRQEERIVGNDNTVRYQGWILQIPASTHRHHYVKATVTLCHYPDDTLAIFHGHQCLARFTSTGELHDKREQEKQEKLERPDKQEKRALNAGISAPEPSPTALSPPRQRTYPHIQPPPQQQTVALFQD